MEDVVRQGWWGRALALRRPINDSANWSHAEVYHSAPGADPEHFRAVPGVMMTYPLGRLFTVAGPEPITNYHTAAGLSVVHHFALNENDGDWDRMDAATRAAQPFQAVAGYVAADVDRAGPQVLLQEARAVAYGDPRNLGFLAAANFSTGFPLELRRFIRAFVAVPALPSRVVPGAASDADVVVREIPAERHGTYYFVVNTSWHAKPRVRVTLPRAGAVTELVASRRSNEQTVVLDLQPAELRAYHVAPILKPESGRQNE
jgi:hypothetical protein